MPKQGAGPEQPYVNNLRNYETSTQMEQLRQVNKMSSRINHFSPLKDHFVEGQLSVRKPEDRRTILQMSLYQNQQSKRLASPTRVYQSPQR